MANHQFQRWAFCRPLATTDGLTTLVAAPTSPRILVVQRLCINVTTSAAQAWDIEDTSGSPVELFKAPASLAVGFYEIDLGEQGIKLTAASGLEYHPGAAGVGLTVSGYGYLLEG